MTKHAIRFQHALAARLRNDAGQGALEYIGILIIVGVIVAAVVTIIGDQEDTITGAVTTAIENFLKGNPG